MQNFFESRERKREKLRENGKLWRGWTGKVVGEASDESEQRSKDQTHFICWENKWDSRNIFSSSSSSAVDCLVKKKSMWGKTLARSRARSVFEIIKLFLFQTWKTQQIPVIRNSSEGIFFSRQILCDFGDVCSNIACYLSKNNNKSICEQCSVAITPRYVSLIYMQDEKSCYEFFSSTFCHKFRWRLQNRITHRCGNNNDSLPRRRRFLFGIEKLDAKIWEEKSF